MNQFLPHSTNLSTYMESVTQHPVLSRDEEQLWARRAKYGSKELQTIAREKLIVSNLRFVVQQANKFKNYTLSGKFSIMDLIQEGNAGLVHAFNKYDYRKGYRFTTYAVHWIRAKIMGFLINNHSVIKIGTTGAERQLFFKMQEIRQLLNIVDSDEREQAREDLAEQLNLSVEQIKHMEKRVSFKETPAERLLLNQQSTDTSVTIKDILPSDDMVEENVLSTDNQDKLKNVIKSAMVDLNKKEKDVIELRWLQDDGLTLQAIAEIYGLSRERIRQIESAALKKIKQKMRNNPTTKEILENLSG